MKALLKHKRLLAILASVLVSVLVVIGTSTDCFADSYSNTQNQKAAGGVTVVGRNATTKGTVTGISYIPYPTNQYAGGAYFTSEIYNTYSLFFGDGWGEYWSGQISFSDALTVTTGTVTGYTLEGCYYDVSIVDVPDCCNITLWQSGGTYSYYLEVDDFMPTQNAGGFDFTILVRCTSHCYGSSLQNFRSIQPPTINVTHNITTVNNNMIHGLVSRESLRIAKGIDNSSQVTSIYNKLLNIDNRLVWTDGSVIYDAADLLWMLNGETAGLHTDTNAYFTTLSMQLSDYLTYSNKDTGQYLYEIDGIIGSIYNLLNSDSSGKSSAAETAINNANSSEQTIMNSATSILSNGSSGFGSGTSFSSGLQSIQGVNYTGFKNQNARSIEFWHDVGEYILNPTYLGAIATFLIIVLMVGFTAWVLKL